MTVKPVAFGGDGLAGDGRGIGSALAQTRLGRPAMSEGFAGALAGAEHACAAPSSAATGLEAPLSAEHPFFDHLELAANGGRRAGPSQPAAANTHTAGQPATKTSEKPAERLAASAAPAGTPALCPHVANPLPAPDRSTAPFVPQQARAAGVALRQFTAVNGEGRGQAVESSAPQPAGPSQPESRSTEHPAARPAAAGSVADVRPAAPHPAPPAVRAASQPVAVTAARQAGLPAERPEPLALKEQAVLKPAKPAQIQPSQGAQIQPSQAAAHPPAAPAAPAPSPAPHPAEAAARLAYDPSLRMTMKPGEAHVSLDAGGGVSLHVQVQNGVANVRAEGPAAPLLSQNLPGLRASLASNGLSLGGFESGDPPGREHPHGESAEAPKRAGKAIANPPRRSSKSSLEVEA